MIKNTDLLYSKILTNDIIDLQVVGAGYEVTTKQKEVRGPDYFTYFSLHYVIAGSGHLLVNGNMHSVEKDQIFTILPTAKTEYYPCKKNPWKYIWVNFDGLKAKEIMMRIGVTESSPILTLRNKNNIKSLFYALINECEKTYRTSDLTALGYLYLIAARLSELQETESQFTMSNDAYINRAIGYINNNYSSPDINLTSIARYLNLNENYLSRLFSKTMGIDFSHYLIDKRMSAALTLFNEGADSVSYVAYAIGYSNPAYFSNVFKKYQNVTPTQYIQTLKNTKT